MKALQRIRLDRLAARLARCRPHPDHADDEAGIAVCRLAVDALRAGNYGVGAMLIDAAGQPLIETTNRVFEPVFSSAAHAEMVAVDRLEQDYPDLAPADLTLLVSLEPCPMCYTRLKLSGIGQVRYLAPDPPGGMVHAAERLPDIWRLLSPEQRFAPAAVSPEIRHLARRLFQTNLRALRRRLLSRIQPPR